MAKANHKLKGKLRELDKTQKEAAQFLGISEVAFNMKINGLNSFKVDEANKLSNWLNLTDDEKIDIFFVA